MSDTLKKQYLIAKILILTDDIDANAGSSLTYLTIPDPKEMEKWSLDKLEILKRKLYDLAWPMRKIVSRTKC